MALGTDHTLSGQLKVTGAEGREHESSLYAKRCSQIGTNQQGRWAYNADSNIQYAGYAPKGLAEGTDGWLLQKFTYDVSQRLTTREIAYGNWTNRTGESYE